MMNSSLVEQWHRLVETGDVSALDAVLADGVVFHSPVVHTPQVGKTLTIRYLTAAFHLLANESFTYTRQVSSGRDAVLEFEVDIDGFRINGVDMIRWDEQGKIVDFKVMLRPIRALELVRRKMSELLGLENP